MDSEQPLPAKGLGSRQEHALVLLFVKCEDCEGSWHRPRSVGVLLSVMQGLAARGLAERASGKVHRFRITEAGRAEARRRHPRLAGGGPGHDLGRRPG